MSNNINNTYINTYRLYAKNVKNEVYRIYDPIEKKFILSGWNSIYSKQASVWTAKNAVTRVISTLPEEIKNRVQIKTYVLDVEEKE